MGHDPAYYIQGVRGGDRRVLAKTITLIESILPEHQQMAQRVLNCLLPHTGQAVRLGISGVPGVGKSTFVESLGTWLTDQNLRVAVLAVDPSSRRSGGSIMADKTRMEKLSTNPRAFIRPSPAGETLGGVARKTRESLLVCEAAGFDVVLVETVGVGQSEIAVSSMVDFFLVLMLAGAGDELQGIKKGVLELADALAINKADGDNLENAKRAQMAYENALRLLTPTSHTWSPPVLTCSALESDGIEKIWNVVLDHRHRLSESGELDVRRREQSLEWMKSMVEEELRDRFYAKSDVRKMLPDLQRSVMAGTLNATAAAERLLFFLDKNAASD